uniref:Uncharacterized protein n=1 Tax=Pristionchus pacificus TaxID=54126 RepID=A0A2A6CTG2_PRIPA|eukprot:PDM81323.1 hypothetical protein PRIPAC_36326 [Pristionchus pacificus]
MSRRVTIDEMRKGIWSAYGTTSGSDSRTRDGRNKWRMNRRRRERERRQMITIKLGRRRIMEQWRREHDEKTIQRTTNEKKKRKGVE